MSLSPPAAPRDIHPPSLYCAGTEGKGGSMANSVSMTSFCRSTLLAADAE
jgi:hypothetical protein